jgi:uncharacterized protein
MLFFIFISRGNKNNKGGGKGFRTGSLADTLFTAIILSNVCRGSFDGGGSSGGW